MHIVSLKKGLTVEQAKEDSAGIAALGFFINVRQHFKLVLPLKLHFCRISACSNEYRKCNYNVFSLKATEDGDMSGPWSMLMSYLTNLTGTGHFGLSFHFDSLCDTAIQQGAGTKR